jgi:hypothetical protein
MDFYVFHSTICGEYSNAGTGIKSKSLKVFDKDLHIHGTIRIGIYVVPYGVNLTYMHFTQCFSVTIPASRSHPPCKIDRQWQKDKSHWHQTAKFQ